MRARLAAKVLGDGLRFVAQAIPNRTTIPILSDIKIEVRDTSLVLTGTDLDHEHTAAVDAMEVDAGAVAVPAARLTELVAKLPPASEVTLKTEADHVVVSCGRGRWKLPTLPAEDFPELTGPGEEAAQFALPAAEAKRLVARLSHAISKEEARYYLSGVYLQQQADQLVAVATNGHALARIVIALELELEQALGVIVPTAVIATLGDLAAQGDVDVKVDRQKISLRCGAWSVVSKLIDGTFPNVARVIPEASKNHIEVASGEVVASIERHAAAAETDTSIGLTWGRGNGLTTCLSRAEDGASEELEARSVGRGRVALAAHYLVDTLKALGAKAVTIDHDGGGSPVRFTTADEPATLAIIMPLTWFEPAGDDQPQPPARTRRGK